MATGDALLELLRVEKDGPMPSDAGIQSRLRHRLLQGETLSNDNMTQQERASIYFARSTLEAAGYRITGSPLEGLTVTNRERNPSPTGVRRYATQSQARQKAGKAKATTTQPAASSANGTTRTARILEVVTNASGPITSDAVAELVGCEAQQARTALTSLHTQGRVVSVPIERQGNGPRQAWQPANGKPVTTTTRALVGPMDRPAAPPKRPASVPPLPTAGETLSVRGITLDTDNVATLALRNGTRSWVVTVVGFSAD